MYLFPAAEIRAESLRLTEAKEENERNAMTPAVFMDVRIEILRHPFFCRTEGTH